MSKRTPLLIIQDMLEAVSKILSYTDNYTYEEFIVDQKTVDAVLRNLTVLGEGARNIPESLREEYSEVEWGKIARSRNIIVHDYFDIDREIIWKIITNYIPPLKEQLENVISKTS